VPNAKVVATNEGTGVQSNTTTDSAGAFLFSSLPIGLYKAEISAPGFQTTVFSGLKLDVATTVTKNVQLNIGPASQTVEVTADEPLVDTSNNTMGQVINDKTVQQIPLNGRHFTDLSLLTPGTITLRLTDSCRLRCAARARLESTPQGSAKTPPTGSSTV